VPTSPRESPFPVQCEARSAPSTLLVLLLFDFFLRFESCAFAHVASVPWTESPVDLFGPCFRMNFFCVLLRRARIFWPVFQIACFFFFHDFSPFFPLLRVLGLSALRSALLVRKSDSCCLPLWTLIPFFPAGNFATPAARPPAALPFACAFVLLASFFSRGIHFSPLSVIPFPPIQVLSVRRTV